MRNTNYTVGERRAWKAEEYCGHKPTVYDWCRMAAYLDGEGYLNINPYTSRHAGRGKGAGVVQVRISVHNTNPILTRWCKDTFGGNVVIMRRDPNRTKGWKDAHVWSCTAGRASWVLYNCLPWFLLKNKQAQLLMQVQEDIDQTRQGRGRRLTDEQIVFRDIATKRLRVLNAKGIAATTQGE